MSESTSENETGSTHETPDQGLIGDEQLPDDLRPDKNPMARDPDEDPQGAIAGDEGGDSAGPPAGGAADAGQPG
jgi:hypothetical protein